ncbi:hypothetical protein Dimus_001653 [Dionaea muscipula]
MPEVTEAKNASRTGLGEENGGGCVGDEFVIYRSAWTPMKRVAISLRWRFQIRTTLRQPHSLLRRRRVLERATNVLGEIQEE